MLKLDMIKDVDVFPEDCECPENALIASAHSNHLEVVRMLVAKGANVNVVDLKYGATALRYAVRFQNLDMARLLLEHGARVNVEDKHGKLLVEYAIIDAKPNDARVLQLLLEKGGDADAVSRTGSPLVAVAVVAGNPAALELLLGRYKADPNVRLSGERGDPILSLAAAQSHADGTRMVGMLLQAGANPWVRYGGSDLINSLRGSKEAYAHAGDVPLKVKAAQTAMLREIDASIALLEEARRRVPKPARY
jgi:ankyrin repeat protein